jgi:hypothetical protein
MTRDLILPHGAKHMNKRNLKKLLGWAGVSDAAIKKMLAAYDCVGISGRVRITTYKAGTKKILNRSKWSKNLVVSGVDTGRNLICQRLGSTNTYSLNITHADIGTGTSTPQNSDTALQTPTARGPLTVSIINGNAVTLQFFFSDSILSNGTYTEFGTFIDGSGSIGTGKLFNRALFGSPYVKVSGQDTTVEVDLTINAI